MFVAHQIVGGRRQHADVIDQNGNWPEGVPAFLHYPRPILRRRNVVAHGQCRARALPIDGCHHRAHRRVIDVGGDPPCSLFGQRLASASPWPVAAPVTSTTFPVTRFSLLDMFEIDTQHKVVILDRFVFCACHPYQFRIPLR